MSLIKERLSTPKTKFLKYKPQDMDTKTNQLFRIRKVLVLFIVLLILSGITAFPIEIQIDFVMEYIHVFPDLIQQWFAQIAYGVKQTNAEFPFIAYGTDWLAFAHIVIAIFFIGPLIDPVKNIWTLMAGMVGCILVFPLAFIAGHVREIPFWWQLIDCSFGFFGFLVLYKCYSMIKLYEIGSNP